MRIAIDAHSVGTKLGGNESYAVNLIEALAQIDEVNEYTLFVTTAEARDRFHERWPNFKVRSTLPHTPLIRIPLTLSAELRKHGCTVNLSLPSPAGVLDLLASRKGKLLALVLCSHDHGSISVSSARVLHRCGLRIRPVSPRELDTHSARIVEEVIAALRD